MDDTYIPIIETPYPDYQDLSVVHKGWYHLPQQQLDLIQRPFRRIALQEEAVASITVHERSPLQQTQLAIVLRHLDLLIQRGDKLQIWKEPWFSSVELCPPDRIGDETVYPICCTFGDLALNVVESKPELLG